MVADAAPEVIFNHELTPDTVIQPGLDGQTSVSEHDFRPGVGPSMYFSVADPDGPRDIESVKVCLYLDADDGVPGCVDPDGRTSALITWSSLRGSFKSGTPDNQHRPTWLTRSGFSVDDGPTGDPAYGSPSDRWRASFDALACGPDAATACSSEAVIHGDAALTGPAASTLDFAIRYLPSAVMRMGSSATGAPAPVSTPEAAASRSSTPNESMASSARVGSGRWRVRIAVTDAQGKSNPADNQMSYDRKIEVRHYSSIVDLGDSNKWGTGAAGSRKLVPGSQVVSGATSIGTLISNGPTAISMAMSNLVSPGRPDSTIANMSNTDPRVRPVAGRFAFDCAPGDSSSDFDASSLVRVPVVGGNHGVAEPAVVVSNATPTGTPLVGTAAVTTTCRMWISSGRPGTYSGTLSILSGGVPIKT